MLEPQGTARLALFHVASVKEKQGRALNFILSTQRPMVGSTSYGYIWAHTWMGVGIFLCGLVGRVVNSAHGVGRFSPGWSGLVRRLEEDLRQKFSSILRII